MPLFNRGAATSLINCSTSTRNILAGFSATWDIRKLLITAALQQEEFLSGMLIFSPSCIVRLTGSEVQIECMPPENPAIVFQQIDEQPEGISGEQLTVTDIRPDLDKEEYVEIINCLKRHIQRGDCYEINFCQEYVAEQVSIDPLFVYHQLRTISPNPFGAFYRLEDRYCLCASPERFLQKKADRVISQPIKGTSRRHPVILNWMKRPGNTC